MRHNEHLWEEVGIKEFYKIVRHKNGFYTGSKLKDVKAGGGFHFYLLAVKEINNTKAELYCTELAKAKMNDHKTLEKFDKYIRILEIQAEREK